MSAAASGVWFARHVGPGGGAVVVAVLGGEFPAGSVVTLPGPAVRPGSWLAEVHVPLAGKVPTRVLVAPAAAPDAPHLWTVLLAAGDHVDLVAFSTSTLRDGSVVGRRQFDSLGLSWAAQAGAVRWSPRTGVVSQVYVPPRLRRRGVASRLLTTSVGIQVGMGWATVHGDGRYTELGEAWLAGAPECWQDRVPARTRTLPPMTPAAEAAGVPARYLVPDGAAPVRRAG